MKMVRMESLNFNWCKSYICRSRVELWLSIHWMQVKEIETYIIVQRKYKPKMHVKMWQSWGELNGPVQFHGPLLNLEYASPKCTFVR